MGELVEHPDKGDSDIDVVRVGEGQTPVSLKTYQDVYHQVTGRTEQIRKRYSENLLIEIGEIEQLNYKIRQLYDVHKLVAKSETITIFHIKERKEQFTSFERFHAYNTNTANPTVSLVLRYNFSIIPADKKRPQEYVVNVRLTSKVVAMQQLNEDAPPFMHGQFFGFMAGPTVEVTVDYADYVIARGFLEAVDEWVKGCRATPTSKTLRLLQRYSHHIPGIAQILAAAALTHYAYQAVPSIAADANTTAVWARFAIVFAGGFYITIQLVEKFSKLIETSIDTFPEISYVKINRGDEKIIFAAQKEKPFVWTRLVLGIVGTMVIAILSSKLEKLI